MDESLPVPCEIRIGTSGYDYPEWKASFYPQDLARKDFLSFYSKQFDTVELNFSYYGMPKAGQLARLLENSGPQCLFSIKAHRSLTHEIDPAHWRDHLARIPRGYTAPRESPNASAPSCFNSRNPSITSRIAGDTWMPCSGSSGA